MMLWWAAQAFGLLMFYVFVLGPIALIAYVIYRIVRKEE